MSKYAVISGETPSELRDKIIQIFNSPEKMHGGLIKTILVSKTGAEGLDLKNIRETHQIEPYWDKSRDAQLIARAVRVGSHDDLPKEERDVQPYLYIATKNTEMWDLMRKEDREESSIDELFNSRAIEKYKLNMEFRELLSQVSIECQIFGYDHCRVCAPTNQILYKDDAMVDVKLPDPCNTLIETEVSATEIEYDEKKYYYIKKSSLDTDTDITFYEYNDNLGGYSPIDPASPIIDKLMELIN
jgi:superfamily II DNA or RNA helicase